MVKTECKLSTPDRSEGLWDEKRLGKKCEANVLWTTNGTGDRDLSITESYNGNTQRNKNHDLRNKEAEYPVSETLCIGSGSQ